MGLNVVVFFQKIKKIWLESCWQRNIGMILLFLLTR